jgi:hypothetical protein
VADEGAVDVDEGRQPPAEDGTRRAPIAAGTRLSPLQEAYSAYTDHAVHCPSCRDIDRGRCSAGDDLWSQYQDVGAEAYRQLRRT